MNIRHKVENNLSSNSQKGNVVVFVLIGLTVVIISAVLIKNGYIFPQKPTTTQKTVINNTIVRRSKDLELISKALTGKAIDINTGKVVTAARVFSTSDKNVYLELDFNNSQKGLIVDYIRYHKGRYVDHEEVTITKDSIESLTFKWTLSNAVLANMLDGNWRVAVYTKGILAKRINYEVQNSKVSYFMDDLVTPKDADYLLSYALPNSHKN